MLKSFLFHDYETTGTNPALDWPTQFAAIRTDAEFNEIGEPINLFCKQPKDHLPHPMATLVTGVSPQEINKKGVIEPEFIRQINDAFMEPGTCGLGYNTLRFDDEVTRHALYRNFYDPYAREWQNGNSRWDLIDMVRLAGALRPEGIEWPVREDGYKSFRLEELTAANGIDHGSAHDALSDVRATIAMARLVRERQPKLFNFVLMHRGKKDISQLLNLAVRKSVVHVSGMFGAQRHNMAIVIPLAEHPINKNGIVVYDLSADPTPLLELSTDEIRARLFTPADQLPEGHERIPLKTVHINKCPVIAPLGVIRSEDQDRLGLDLALCEDHRQQLLKHVELKDKVQAVFSEPPAGKNTDPDAMLYSGGFFSPADKQMMNRIITTLPEHLGSAGLSFRDGRLDEMLFRYRGRHHPETMDLEDKEQWKRYCKDRLNNPEYPEILGFSGFQKALHEASAMVEGDTAKMTLLKQLESYVESLHKELMS